MTGADELVPGLNPGHPWIIFSRWRMGWLTALGTFLVGMLMSLVSGFVMQGSAAGGAPLYLNLTLAILCGALAAAFGPMLRRFFPFSQALLFGALTLATLGVLTFLVALGEWLVRGTCERNTYCAGAGEQMVSAFFFLFFIGLPTFLAAAIGFALAQWSPTRRGTKVFWPLLAGTLLVYMTAFVLAMLGVFDSPTAPQSSMSCSFVDAQGVETEVPCGGF